MDLLLRDFFKLFLVFIPLLIVIYIIDIIINRKTARRKNILINFKFEFLRAVFISYFIMLLYLTLGHQELFTTGNGGINLVPFNNIGERYHYLAVYGIVGNIMLFFPFGLILPELLKTKKKFVVPIFAFLTSAIIETIQIPIGRTCDIDDLICNTFGAILGFVFYLFIKGILKIIEKRKKNHSN